MVARLELSSLNMAYTVLRGLSVFKTLNNCIKQGSLYFVICPGQGPKMSYTGLEF